MKLLNKLFFLYKKPWYKKDKLSKFEKQTKRFIRKYPQYTIGRGSYGVPEIHDWNEGSTLKIGAFCSISAYVQIFLGGEHRLDWITTSPLSYMFDDKEIQDYGKSKGDVVIGNDVWICANSIILSGVTIGDGAVIANGAIVTRDVKPYSVVAGNPAKHIKYRFSSDTIEQLLKIRWWDWPEHLIRSHIQLLQSNDIDNLLKISAEIQQNNLQNKEFSKQS